MLGIIENDAIGFAKKILSRKAEYILKGYPEQDFPYPEIEETFLAIKNSIKTKLENINAFKAELKQSNLNMDYKLIVLLTYDRLEKEYKDIEQAIKELRKGKTVEFSTIGRRAGKKDISYPYGDSIRVCERYSATTDLYVRAIKRFEKLGPDKSYFKEALRLSGMNHPPKKVSEYIKLLEDQDYINAYEKLLQAYKNDPKQQDTYNELLEGKSNGYRFPQRTTTLKLILQEMVIPPNFQTPRYGNHLEEDLLHFDIVLYPTMEPVSMDFFNNTRQSPVFILGVADLIYADEFNLTSGDFIHHDAKHTLDMLARNWAALREQGKSFDEMRELFEKNKQEIEKRYLGLLKVDPAQLPIDTQRIKKILDKLKNTGFLTKQLMIDTRHDIDSDRSAEALFRHALNDLVTPEELNVLYAYLLNQLRFKEAMRLIIFELIHEEGYPYDWNSLIRGLTEKNMFYGETIKDFLIEKIVHFFTSKHESQLVSNEVVKKIPEANDVLVEWCKELRQLAVNEGYISDVNLKARYDMLRGPKQINPYQKLKGEQEYQKTEERIGNIYLQRTQSDKKLSGNADKALLKRKKPKT